MNIQTKYYSLEHPNTDTSILSPLLEHIKRAKRRVNTWRKNARARKELEGMPDYLLRDIGLSESQRDMELSKPFWVD